MAITVTPDWVVVNSAEATTGWSAVGGQGAAAITLKAQGTYSIDSDPNGTGLKGLSHLLATAVDIRDQHVLMWLAVGTNEVNTFANGGHRIRLGATSATSNYREFYVGGNDKGLGSVKGMWNAYCVDTRRAADNVNGTLNMNSVRAFGHINNITIVPNGINSLFFNDQIIRGRELHVLGTAGDTPGIAANDATNGRGIFKDVNGIYYILGRVRIGATAAATASDFTDTLKVWNFEDQVVSATFHKVELVGSSGGVNTAIFGTKIGTGVAASGAGGNTFLSGGTVPFRVEAIDSLITVGFYGCIFTGPSAQKQDNLRYYATFTGATYTEDTEDAGDALTGDILFMPASEGVGDGCVFGHEDKFSQLNITISTAGTVGAGVWEYWNGTAWAALTDVTDGTNQLKATPGVYTVTYAIPDDWAEQTLDTDRNFYFLRFRVTTVYTVNPVGTLANCTMGGTVRMEASTVESIGCTYTGMDGIRIRNGAILRKAVISNSVSSAKYAALDLGSADPATDTVREITILNSTNGILLKGTSAGATTYNLNNIKFSGNTNDVRVDFPAGATITINILNGGDTPSIQNVNGSTVTIVNAVSVKVTCQDATTFADLQSARVLLEAFTGGALPYDVTVTITRVTTTATVAHTTHGFKVGEKVTIRDAVQPEYNGVKTITAITTDTYDYTVSGTPTTPATGTIKATAVILDGDTDVNGEILNSGFNYNGVQPVLGTARKSSITPFYKTSKIPGEITTAGFNTVTLLIKDE